MHMQKELTHSETTPFFFDIVRQCELFPVQMVALDTHGLADTST